MSAQATLNAKTAISSIDISGASLAINPRGKDAKGILNWIAPGATSLDDITVDFSYRVPTATRKTTKASLRVFVPKTVVNSTTGLTTRIGEMIGSTEFTFPESATFSDRQKLVDILTSALCAAEFRTALSTGDTMY